MFMICVHYKELVLMPVMLQIYVVTLGRGLQEMCSKKK